MVALENRAAPTLGRARQGRWGPAGRPKPSARARSHLPHAHGRQLLRTEAGRQDVSASQFEVVSKQHKTAASGSTGAAGRLWHGSAHAFGGRAKQPLAGVQLRKQVGAAGRPPVGAATNSAGGTSRLAVPASPRHSIATTRRPCAAMCQTMCAKSRGQFGFAASTFILIGLHSVHEAPPQDVHSKLEGKL